MLRKPAALELGPGLCGYLPGAGSGGGPLLVASVDGFQPLTFGRNTAGERLRVRGLGLVVAGGGFSGLLPGVGLSLRGEPELAGYVWWGAGLDASGLEGAGFEFTVDHAADDVIFVSDSSS
jgi:hypothetical protein